MQPNSASPVSSSDYDGQAPAGPKASTSKRKSSAGRPLKRWDPAEDQLVLLAVEYIVGRDKVDLDWSAVAKVVEPSGTLSGEAIKQHLLKLRQAREAYDQPVPPKIDRSSHSKKKQKRGPVQTPIKQEFETQQALTSFLAPPMTMVNSNLLHFKPNKPSSMSTNDTNIEPVRGSRKRKAANNKDIGMDDTLNIKIMTSGSKKTAPGKQVVQSKGKEDGTPKKKRRTNVASNFPEGDPGGYNPFDNPYAHFGGSNIGLRAQKRVNYSEQQIEEDTGVQGITSPDTPSPVTYDTNVAIGYQSALQTDDNATQVMDSVAVQPTLAGTLLAGEYNDMESPSSRTSSPYTAENGAGPQESLRGTTFADATDFDSMNQFQAVNSSSGTTLGQQFHGLPWGTISETSEPEWERFSAYGKTPTSSGTFLAGEQFFDQVPRSMLKDEVNECHTGSMPGVGLGGETGMFPMDRFTPREEFGGFDFGIGLGDDEEMELFGDQAYKLGKSFD